MIAFEKHMGKLITIEELEKTIGDKIFNPIDGGLDVHKYAELIWRDALEWVSSENEDGGQCDPVKIEAELMS